MFQNQGGNPVALQEISARMYLFAAAPDFGWSWGGRQFFHVFNLRDQFMLHSASMQPA